MLLSLNWLKDFVKIPKEVTPADLALRLSMHTVEVEEWSDKAGAFNGVVIGKVLSVDKHPNADRLRITTVDIKKEILTIVCGAPNVAEGQLVPVATVGTILPNGLEIKESEIRGEKSSGMICAEDELGLGDNHEGIMVLDKKAKVGESFAKYLSLDDIVLEIDNKSLSNRSDLWGHYGMAREISTFYNTELKNYQEFLKPEIEEGEEKLDVKVEDKKLCPRYMGLVIKDIKVEESPRWLKDRLFAIGLKPINNIVDVTNYVMFETGQPLHAFSREMVDKIVVRLAEKGEHIETLDGKERELGESVLVIANSKEPIAIAGVMGGQKSAISNETKEIIIEAANFDAISVRKTSGKLNLRTDSSMRYEKSLDPNLTEIGLRRAYALIKKVCKNAKAESRIVDISNFNLNQGPIIFNLDWANAKIGQEIPAEKVINILEKLGFLIKQNERDLEITIPSWRAAKDIAIAEDVLEEVMRIYGYDNIVNSAPLVPLNPPELLTELVLERKIKNILANNFALSETYNYSFASESNLKKLEIDFNNYLKLVNPISDQLTVLRQNLIVGLLSNVKVNQFNYNETRLFESGRVYLDTPGVFDKAGDDKERLPYQQKRLAFVLSGKNGDYFNEAKGIVESLIKLVYNGNWETEFVMVEDFPIYCDKKNAARIRVNNHDLGLVAMVNKNLAGKFGLKNETAFVELNFVEILSLFNICLAAKYQAVPKYPAITRDLAFVVDSGMMYNDLRREIKSFNDLITDVELFDIYQGEKIGDDKKSLAFHIVYQSPERTLRAEEVDEIQTSLFSRLNEKFGAQLRDF